MRLYHPKTLEILANREDIPKRYSCSVWSEIFKWKASGKSHPKMFIDNEFALGMYAGEVYKLATKKGCNLNEELKNKMSDAFIRGFKYGTYDFPIYVMESINDTPYVGYFDDNYLFSDACSLYYKGINIFPDIFGDKWRKYVPVESHKEIIRQCNKVI